jgi:hypothetical protein
VFRRGLFGGPSARPALSHALVPTPGQPYYLADEAVPQTGVQARRFRQARGSDGTTYVWSGFVVRPGTGPGGSGLAFDVVAPLQEM